MAYLPTILPPDGDGRLWVWGQMAITWSKFTRLLQHHRIRSISRDEGMRLLSKRYWRIWTEVVAHLKCLFCHWPECTAAIRETRSSLSIQTGRLLNGIFVTLNLMEFIYLASVEITNNMQPCNRTYYSKIYWRLNLFWAAYRLSSEAPNCICSL